MTDIPKFQNSHDESEYIFLFEEKLAEYKFFFDKVKDEFLPGVKYTAVDAHWFNALRDITSSVVYEASSQFRKTREEYKNDDDMFVPRWALKDLIKEAFAEINNQETQETND